MSDGPVGESTVDERPAEPTVERRLARLYALQRDFRDRWTLTLLAATVGITLATVHWGGLVAGGALVGLCWPTLRRAVVAGLGFGLVVLAVVAVRFAVAGSLPQYLGMGPLLAISVVVPLVAGPLGATVRGLLPDAPGGDESGV